VLYNIFAHCHYYLTILIYKYSSAVSSPVGPVAIGAYKGETQQVKTSGVSPVGPNCYFLFSVKCHFNFLYHYIIILCVG